MEFDVVIEIPKGQRNKYEMDHETGRIRLDRMLFTSTRYPADYGFVEHTLADDGDPLDALVLLDEPTFPGCVISCRAIGMFRMRDEMGLDDKACAWRRRIRGWPICATSRTSRSSTVWRSATSSRFTRRWSPARKWRRPTGWTRRPPIARSRRAGIALAALAIWAASRKQPVQLTGPDGLHSDQAIQHVALAGHPADRCRALAGKVHRWEVSGGIDRAAGGGMMT